MLSNKPNLRNTSKKYPISPSPMENLKKIKSLSSPKTTYSGNYSKKLKKSKSSSVFYKILP
jgi:hypothetical protein